MEKILKELKLIINKELYQKCKITFEEFKLANEKKWRKKKLDTVKTRSELLLRKTILIRI